MVKALTRHSLHAALLQLGLVEEAIRGVLRDIMNGLPRVRAEIGTTRHADDARTGSQRSDTGHLRLRRLSWTSGLTSVDGTGSGGSVQNV
jgi:hypothetical protein